MVSLDFNIQYFEIYKIMLQFVRYIVYAAPLPHVLRRKVLL